MFYFKKFLQPVLLLALSIPVLAQDAPSTPSTSSAPSTPAQNEAGAVLLYGDSGWSFGLPAVRASVGNVISPEKKTLIAPSFGVGVTAWKFVVPFVDFTFYDTGKATATVGSVTSQAEATTFTVNGGLRLVAGKSKARGYVEFGGGLLQQNLKGTFSAGSQSNGANANGSTSSLMYGAGVQLFAGRKWGTDIGFDAFHVGQPLNGAGQNFSRIRVGIFYQTKSAIQ